MSFRSASSVVALVLLTSCGGSGSSDVPAAEGARYLDEAIGLMQEYSYRREAIDWVGLRRQASELVPSGAGIADIDPALQRALDLLGDHHSFIQKAQGGRIAAAAPAGCEGAWTAPGTLPDDIAYVRVPQGAAVTTRASTQAYADELASAVAAQDRAGLSGWIVDLRGVSAVNGAAVMAGLGAILGDGTVAGVAFLGGWQDPLSLQAGRLSATSGVLAQVSAPVALLAPGPKVAVLQDGSTSGDGELAAIAFVGRPASRSFGAPTCGRSTGLGPYPLSDGALLYIATAVYADRRKALYGGKVQPDETLGDGAAAIARAVEWLHAP